MRRDAAWFVAALGRLAAGFDADGLAPATTVAEVIAMNATAELLHAA